MIMIGELLVHYLIVYQTLGVRQTNMDDNYNATWDDSQMIFKMTSLRDKFGNSKKILKTVAIEIQNDIERHFNEEASPQGKWEKSRRAIRDGGKTLQDKGMLRRIQMNIGEDEALIGTTVNYGRVHNQGGMAGPNKRVKMPKREWAWVSAIGIIKIGTALELLFTKFVMEVGFKKQ